MNQYDVAVVGGGGTGAAAAYDLALRGLSVILFERGALTSGTTGRHHGQLHSGARYALGDAGVARECMAETRVLRRIARDCVEYNQGLFLAIDEEEADAADAFVAACRNADIPATEIPVSRALAMEPAIQPRTRRAVIVPDGTIDAYRLPMRFFASARAHGAVIEDFTEVVGMDVAGGAIQALRVRNARNGAERVVEVAAALNAGGPWAGRVAELAGSHVGVTAAAGVMVAVEGRATDMVISRLRKAPGDGDIIVPQRQLSIIGTTLRKEDDPDGLSPTEEETRFLLSAADELVPGFSSRRLRASWAAARPLAGLSDDEGRSISRDVALIDHDERDGVSGFFSILGGKATILRAMGEIAADAVCRHLGVEEPCKTAQFELFPYRDFWRIR